MRETAINFPTSLSAEEKHLKELFDKLKTIRKAIAGATRANVIAGGGDLSKAERRNSKRSLQEAEEATEAVKRKVMSGAINLKKANEKSTFKRSKVLEKRRDSDAKLKVDTSDAGNSSGNEMLSPTSVHFSSPNFAPPDGDQSKVNRGPTLYVRGYDLVSDSLHKAFQRYGTITRLFIEDRQKSAFITFGTTEQAEEAIKQMDGNMVNGITLRVSFARRQNQNGVPSARTVPAGLFARRGSRVSGEGAQQGEQCGLRSPPPPPQQSLTTPPVQLAWSQATSRKSSEGESSIQPTRRRADSRTLVAYDDEPVA